MRQSTEIHDYLLVARIFVWTPFMRLTGSGFTRKLGLDAWSMGGG